MGKLVRDRIPDLPDLPGEKAVYRTLDSKEFRRELFAKLVEEALEAQAACEDPKTGSNMDHIAKELADLLCVMRTVCSVSHLSWQYVLDMEAQKLLERGGFSRRMYREVSE